MKYSTTVPADFSQVSLSNTNVMESASLWVDYIYLDTDERRRFAQLSHEYLIEQLQYPGEETVSVTSNKIKLAFNHPVKELVWVVQRQTNIDAKQSFNYTSSYDGTILSQDNYLGNNILHSVKNSLETTSNLALQFISNMEDTGLNNCSLAKLQLNGQDRFAERDGDYFNIVQPYYHHTRTPAPGINIYSFGLKPEEHQPSGTCNFSRIDNAKMIFNNPVTANAGSVNIHLFAINYNVLRIMSGMGGLAYSN